MICYNGYVGAKLSRYQHLTVNQESAGSSPAAPATFEIKH